MTEKKDWEEILKNNEETLEKLINQTMNNEEVAKPQIEAMILLAKHKIAEFPEDPMPEEVKDLVK